MPQPDRPLGSADRAQQGERNRVITAERDKVPKRRRLLLDLDERALDVAMRDAKIADIGEIQLLDFGPGGGVIAIDQHAARLADCGRPEPRPRAARGAEVEGDAGDADRRIRVRALDAQRARPSSTTA